MPSRNPEIRQAAVAGGAAASKQQMSDLDKLAALAAHCSNSNPPSVAITEGAWERIVDKLMAGEPAYTYSNFDKPKLLASLCVHVCVCSKM